MNKVESHGPITPDQGYRSSAMSQLFTADTRQCRMGKNVRHIAREYWQKVRGNDENSHYLISNLRFVAKNPRRYDQRNRIPYCKDQENDSTKNLLAVSD